MKYYIYIKNHMFSEVDDYAAAWDIYRKTCGLTSLLGEVVSLVDGKTGEVIESSGVF